MALEAMFCFASKSETFDRCVKLVETARLDDDAVFVPKLKAWHDEAHITMITRNWQNICRMQPKISLRTGDELATMLWATYFKKSAADVIEARIRYWLPDTPTDKVTRLIRRFVFIAESLPPFVSI